MGLVRLLTIAGVGYDLGGIAELDAKETEAEVPDALEATRRLLMAWFYKTLGIETGMWVKARSVFSGACSNLAVLTEKPK